MHECVTIVGCGTVGSHLAQKLAFMSREPDCPLSTLNLVDMDTIDAKNFPYLYSSSEKNIGVPKVLVLSRLISQINPELIIQTFNTNYPRKVSEYGTGFMVDCRDAKKSSNRFDIKLNIDGEWALIGINPQKKPDGETGRYRMGNSRFYADSLALVACRLIFNSAYKNKYADGEYIVDLKSSLEDFHGTEV